MRSGITYEDEAGSTAEETCRKFRNDVCHSSRALQCNYRLIAFRSIGSGHGCPISKVPVRIKGYSWWRVLPNCPAICVIGSFGGHANHSLPMQRIEGIPKGHDFVRRVINIEGIFETIGLEGSLWVSQDFPSNIFPFEQSGEDSKHRLSARESSSAQSLQASESRTRHTKEHIPLPSRRSNIQPYPKSQSLPDITPNTTNHPDTGPKGASYPDPHYVIRRRVRRLPREGEPGSFFGAGAGYFWWIEREEAQDCG